MEETLKQGITLDVDQEADPYKNVEQPIVPSIKLPNETKKGK